MVLESREDEAWLVVDENSISYRVKAMLVYGEEVVQVQVHP